MKTIGDLDQNERRDFALLSTFLPGFVKEGDVFADKVDKSDPAELIKSAETHLKKEVDEWRQGCIKTILGRVSREY